MRRCTLSEGAQAVVAGEVNAGIRRGRRRLGGRVEKWPVNLKNPAGGRALLCAAPRLANLIGLRSGVAALEIVRVVLMLAVQ
jgi:hypothetical protein